MRSQRVDSLQVLRFVAAFLVLCGHAQQALVKLTGGAPRPWSVIPLDWGLGVDIFFVISGFVMYYMMHDRFGVPGVAADFLRRRVIRVVPLYYLFTTLTLVMGLVLHVPLPSTIRIVFSYLFLPGPTCDLYCTPLLTLGWTLNYEMMFYLVFAAGLLLPYRRGLMLIVGILLLLIAIAAPTPPDWRMIRFWGLPITLEFVAGMGVAHMFLRGMTIPRVLAWTIVAAGFALAVLFYQIGAYDTIGRPFTGGLPAVMIVTASVLGLEPRRRTRWIGWLIAGGNASYALYLSHPFAIHVGEVLDARLGLSARSPALFLAMVILGALIGSAIVHVGIEKPMLRWLNRRWSREGSTGRGDGQPAPGRSGIIVEAETGVR